MRLGLEDHEDLGDRRDGLRGRATQPPNAHPGIDERVGTDPLAREAGAPGVPTSGQELTWATC